MSALTQVFLLSHGGLTAFRLCAGHVCEAIRFDDTDAGRQAFVRQLNNSHALPAGLLVDRADEEFRIATIPHVRRHRAALLARHGARLFGDTPFRQAQLIGREARGRRDDRVAFSGLSRPEALHPWLHCVAQARVPLVAIQSAARVGMHLLPALRARGVVLLVVAGAHELRQSIFDDGVLLFSRRVALIDQQPESRAQTLRDEVARTRHYLRRQSLVEGERELNTHVVTDEVLARQLARESESLLHITPLPAVARMLACSAHAACNTDALMVELMARKPAQGYARREERRHYLRWRRMRGMAAACWAGAAVAAFGAAHQAGLALGSHAVAQTLRAEAAQLEMHAADDTQVKEASHMRAEVEAADRLLAQRQSHRGLLTQAGSVLAGFPEIRLDTLTLTQATLADGPMELALRGHVSGSPARFDAVVQALKTLPGQPEVHVATVPQGDAAAFELTLTVAMP